MTELQGTTALVTGGGRGLGRDFSLALAKLGMKVAFTARTEEQLTETQRLIEATGGKCLALNADAADPACVPDTVRRAEAALGPIDLLVNNAAVIAPMGLDWETDAQEWWRLFEINVRGPYLHAKAILPGMIARGRGRMINVSSHGGHTTTPFAAAYAASKAALTHWTSCIAPTLAPRGVKVFAFGPVGATDMTRRMAAEPGVAESRRAQFRQHLEQGDPRQQQSVAMLLFIASGKADALVGRYISWDDAPQWLTENAERIVKEDALKVHRRT